jgi:hypothetical protein
MVKKMIKKIKLISMIFKLSKLESNNYVFGYKVRKVINLYRENKKINKEDIFKEVVEQ